MNFRPWITISGLIIFGIMGLFFFYHFLSSHSGGAGNNVPVVEQPTANEEQQLLMTTPMPVLDAASKEAAADRKYLISELHLNIYEAALGDVSSYANDRECLKYAPRVKAWMCVADVCDGTIKNKRPVDCSEALLQAFPSPEVQDQINAALCPVINSPGEETRQALLRNVTDMEDYKVVEFVAYVMAYKKSAKACEEYIKSYVGPYGPKWTYEWYKAWSGCRILSRERTREEEEKDFTTWLEVRQGLGTCSDIVNAEMRQACNTPGATSPHPLHDH